MSENVRYENRSITIGTCENLYYVTYQDFSLALNNGKLSYQPGNDIPANYAKPDSHYRFRFPFPDEDNLSFNNDKCFYRSVIVNVGSSFVSNHVEDAPNNGNTVRIFQQELVTQPENGSVCLCTVCLLDNGLSFTIRENNAAHDLIKAIVKNHIIKENDPVQIKFYREIASRILKGYRLDQTPYISHSKDNRQIKTIAKSIRPRT